MFEVNIGNTEIKAVAINNNGKFLATGNNDGLIKLWNTEQKRLIAEIIHREGEFAFLLRQNPMEPYYKMSKGADELVAFRLGKNIYPTIERIGGFPPDLETPLDYIEFELEGYRANLRGPEINPRKFL